jgi:hypothetical protein
MLVRLSLMLCISTILDNNTLLCCPFFSSFQYTSYPPFLQHPVRIYDHGFHDFMSFFFATTRSCTAYIARILGSLGRYPSGERYLCFTALGGPESALSPFTLLFASISDSWTCLGVGIYSRALGHFVQLSRLRFVAGFEVSFGTRMR